MISATAVLHNNIMHYIISFPSQGANIRQPTVPPHITGVVDPKIWPTECRQRADTYSGRLTLQIDWEVDGARQVPLEKDAGVIPIMVKVRWNVRLNFDYLQLLREWERNALDKFGNTPSIYLCFRVNSAIYTIWILPTW